MELKQQGDSACATDGGGVDGAGSSDLEAVAARLRKQLAEAHARIDALSIDEGQGSDDSVHLLRQQLDELRTQAQYLQQERSSLQGDLQAAREQADSATTAHDEAVAARDRALADLSETESRLEGALTAQAQLTEALRQRTALEEQLGLAAADRDDAHAQRRSMAQRLEGVMAACRQAQQEAEAANAQAARVQSELVAAQQQHRTDSVSMSQLQSQHADVQRQLEELHRASEATAAERSRALAELASTVATLNAAQRRGRDLEVALEAAQEEARRAAAQCAAAAESASEHQRQADRLRETVAQVATQRESVSDELRAVQHRCTELSAAAQEAKTERDSAVADVATWRATCDALRADNAALTTRLQDLSRALPGSRDSAHGDARRSLASPGSPVTVRDAATQSEARARSEGEESAPGVEIGSPGAGVVSDSQQGSPVEEGDSLSSGGDVRGSGTMVASDITPSAPPPRDETAASSAAQAADTSDTVEVAVANGSATGAASPHMGRPHADAHSNAGTRDTPQQTSDVAPQHTSDTAPQQTNDTAPRQLNDAVLQQTSDAAPQQANDTSLQQLSDAALPQTSDAAPQQTSDTLPRQTSDAAPQPASEAANGHAGEDGNKTALVSPGNVGADGQAPVNQHGGVSHEPDVHGDPSNAPASDGGDPAYMHRHGEVSDTDYGYGAEFNAGYGAEYNAGYNAEYNAEYSREYGSYGSEYGDGYSGEYGNGDRAVPGEDGGSVMDLTHEHTDPRAAAAPAEPSTAGTRGAWVAGVDGDGNTYYYNYSTEESSWDPPPGWDEQTVQHDGTDSGGYGDGAAYAQQSPTMPASEDYLAPNGEAANPSDVATDPASGAGPSTADGVGDANDAVATTAEDGSARRARAEKVWMKFFENALANREGASESPSPVNDAPPNVASAVDTRAFWVGINDNQPEVVESAVLLGVPVDVRDPRGACGLHVAAARGGQALVAKLAELGANVDVTDRSGNTPLHLACAGGYGRVVEYLLGCAAQVDAANGAGDTPLHLAAANGNRKCVKLLLRWGADVTARGARKDTALQRVDTISIVKADPRLTATAELLRRHSAANGQRDSGGAAASSVDSSPETGWFSRAVSLVGSVAAGLRGAPGSPLPGTQHVARDEAGQAGDTPGDKARISTAASLRALPEPTSALGIGNNEQPTRRVRSASSHRARQATGELDAVPWRDDVSDVSDATSYSYESSVGSGISPAAHSDRFLAALSDNGEGAGGAGTAAPSAPSALSSALSAIMAIGWRGTSGSDEPDSGGSTKVPPPARKKRVKVANLGNPNGFVFDDRLGIWVMKNGKVLCAQR